MSKSSTPHSSMSEEDAVPLFIYTLEMFLLWFSVLLSACILTFLMRLKKFPLLFRVIYGIWNLRNLAVAVARTTSLVLIIFKMQGTLSEFIISQMHEVIDYFSAFTVAALAIERLVANRLQKTYDSWKPANEHIALVLSVIIVPAICAAYTHKNLTLPRLVFTGFSAFLFGAILGLIITGLYHTRSRQRAVASAATAPGTTKTSTGGRTRYSLQAAAIFFPLALHDTIFRLIIEAGNLYLSHGKGATYGTVSDILSAYQCLSYAIYSFARLHRHVPSRVGIAPHATNTQSANTVSNAEKPPEPKKNSISHERLSIPHERRESDVRMNSNRSVEIERVISTPNTMVIVTSRVEIR